MKKFLAAIASVAMIAVCSTAAFADGDAAVGDSTVIVGASSESTDTGAGNENVPTGVVLTVGPLALAAGALVVSGIVLKKKNK